MGGGRAKGGERELKEAGKEREIERERQMRGNGKMVIKR